MLVLSRKVGETIRIGEDVIIRLTARRREGVSAWESRHRRKCESCGVNWNRTRKLATRA